MMAQILAVSFGLFAGAASVAALRFRRMVGALERQKADLAQALAVRDREHNQRMARLEHDLKSPLGALLGFSTLVRELLQENFEQAPAAILKSVNGIDQAARKMLQIIEDAGSRNSRTHREEALIDRGL